MIELRNQTLENIINASDMMQVEQIIETSINTLKNNKTNDFIIIRFLSKLEMSLKEIQRLQVNTNRTGNLKDAIQYINQHDLNKIKFDTN